MRGLAIAPALALLSGCGTITTLGNTFEGSADYRIIPAEYTCAEKDCLKRPLFDGSPIRISDFSRYQPHPGKVEDKDHRFFQKGDYIQISMKSGVIGWFSEGAEQRILNGLVSAISDSQMKGEVAIIANVTEKALSPGGRDKEGNLEGRVVFYSGDIYTGQHLNEFNVPIFGPYQYQGGPLSIDLWVMELDRAESDQMGAVLETLTSLASKVPSVAGPGIDILGQIGTSFLKSNADDVIGHIRLTLMQPQAGQSVTDPILQVSDVVISRAGDRNESLDIFDGCYYHPGSGRVTAGPKDDGKSCAVGAGTHGDNNIFVLGIRKVPEGTDVSSQVLLADLTERLGKASQAPDFSKAIELIGDDARRASAYSVSVDLLGQLKGKPSLAARDAAAEFILKEMQCTLLVVWHEGEKVQTNVCGERASQRAMNMENFSRLSKQLIEEFGFPADKLSVDALIGTDLDAQAGADVLLAKRKALYQELKPAT